MISQRHVQQIRDSALNVKHLVHLVLLGAVCATVSGCGGGTTDDSVARNHEYDGITPLYLEAGDLTSSGLSHALNNGVATLGIMNNKTLLPGAISSVVTKEFPNVESLEFRRCSGLAEVDYQAIDVHLTGLRSLTIDHSPISTESLAKFTDLEYLGLAGREIDRSHLQAIVESDNPSIRRLSVTNAPRLAAADYELLAELKTMEYIIVGPGAGNHYDSYPIDATFTKSLGAKMPGVRVEFANSNTSLR